MFYNQLGFYGENLKVAMQEHFIGFSIEQLVTDIKDYTDSKSKDFRLVLMIDEVGQYVGTDRDMLLNLQ